MIVVGIVVVVVGGGAEGKTTSNGTDRSLSTKKSRMTSDSEAVIGLFGGGEEESDAIIGPPSDGQSLLFVSLLNESEVVDKAGEGPKLVIS